MGDHPVPPHHAAAEGHGGFAAASEGGGGGVAAGPGYGAGDRDRPAGGLRGGVGTGVPEARPPPSTRRSSFV